MHAQLKIEQMEPRKKERRKESSSSISNSGTFTKFIRLRPFFLFFFFYFSVLVVIIRNALIWRQVHAKFACWAQTIDLIVLCHSFIHFTLFFCFPLFRLFDILIFPIVKTQKNEFTTQWDAHKRKNTHGESTWTVNGWCIYAKSFAQNNPSILFKLTYTLFCGTRIYVTREHKHTHTHDLADNQKSFYSYLSIIIYLVLILIFRYPNPLLNLKWKIPYFSLVFIFVRETKRESARVFI